MINPFRFRKLKDISKVLIANICTDCKIKIDDFVKVNKVVPNAEMLNQMLCLECKAKVSEITNQRLREMGLLK
jgi:hypothetical protein